MISKNRSNSPGYSVWQRLAKGACAFVCICALGWPATAHAQDPPLTQYQATVLSRGLSNPTSIAFHPDGRIYITQKSGRIRLVNPVTGDSTIAATLPAANVREDGLQSLVLDPNFAINRWVYVLFSERMTGDSSLVVARYVTDSATGALLTGTRATLLKIPYTLNSSTAEHTNGYLAFGPEGNLYVALADNTQNIFSGTGAGYAPRDPTRPLYDAQRSAANTNDLRGKILRIHPEANGTYSIPAGNLKDSINNPAFNPNWKTSEDTLSKVRSEIFVMGLRHPFRITVDAQTGWLYWAEPGPNASADNASQGPRGYEVVGLAKGPGNYGWPYCRGNPALIQKASGVTGKFCYTAYNYSGSGTAGAMYNPDSLRNTSINNTGITNLPPMRTHAVWYAYNSTGSSFPIFGSGNGSNAGMLGPIYNYNPSGSSSRLPSVFDRHVFIVEWQRNLLYVARADSAGGIGGLRPFRNVSGARDSVVNGPIDIKIGPDGALYFLNWVGNNYTNNSGNGTLVRFAYTGTQTGIAHPYGVRGIGNVSGQLYVAGTGGVLAWPGGALRADFYALTGERIGSTRRADLTGTPVLRYPESVRGVVRVRFEGR